MGIKGKDFVVVVGDTSATQQIITIKHDEDKLVPIDSHKLMCLSGARVRYCVPCIHARWDQACAICPQGGPAFGALCS